MEQLNPNPVPKLGRPRKLTHILNQMRLTPRDFEILKILYDQKFCSLECLYHRFFDRRRPGEPIPNQMRVARQRLQALKRAEVIKTQRVYSEAKSVYLIAPRGYQTLSGRYPNLVFGPPVKEVDFRNYEHDKRVNLIRVALENSGKVMAWYPERRIRLEGFSVTGIRRPLPETVIPDAIILTPQGKRVVVEVEASVRIWFLAKKALPIEERRLQAIATEPLDEQIKALKGDLTHEEGRNYTLHEAPGKEGVSHRQRGRGSDRARGL